VSNHAILNFILPQVQGGEHGCADSSYDAARTGANTQETILTPQHVGNNLLIRQASLHINDDPRIEAQPLYVSGIDLGGKPHDVVYVSTMANNIWAFDPSNGKPERVNDFETAGV
jgi:hypothetical protein